MIERNEGKERNTPIFTAKATILDKGKGILYTGSITLPVNSQLKDLHVDRPGRSEQLPIKARVDPLSKDVEPNLIIKNHNGKEIIYKLKKRLSKSGVKYFSLGAPTQDIHNFGKAVKADFSVRLDDFLFLVPS